MKKLNTTLFVLFVSIFLFSCGANDDNSFQSNLEEAIDEYNDATEDFEDSMEEMDDNEIDVVDTEEESSSDNDNNEFDETLDKYEKFIDDYIKILKKVKDAQDDPMAAMSVMGEAASMMENAEKLGNELSDNQENLSIEQVDRLVKLQAKLSKAAMEMM